MEIKVGDVYKHFKGKFICEVVGIAKHSETLEPLVIYKHVNNNEKTELWARPVSMWMEQVEYEGKIVPRFEKI